MKFARKDLLGLEDMSREEIDKQVVRMLGTVGILVLYAMLPAEWRYSRALIFLGSLWALAGTLGIRLLLHLAGVTDFQIDLNKQKRMVIVGKADEAQRVSLLLK